MAVCAEYRISHSAFLGWAAADRDKAIWWQVRKAATCQQCGTRPEEWDEDNGGDLHAYVGSVGHCRGCEVRAQHQEQFDKAPKGAYRRGSYVTLTRSPEVG